MCLGGGSPDNSATQIANQQKQDEADREAKVQQGQANIDQAFSQFNDPYFNQYKSDYLGAATPQIEQQYGDAKGTLSAALADRGILSSNIAGTAFGKLDQAHGDQTAAAVNQAADAANSFKNQVDQEKTNLYSLNSASADPSTIATQAEGSAAALVPPTNSTQLGNLFGSVLAPYVNYTRAAMYSPYAMPYGSNGFGSVPTNGSGSSTLVN
jgi:hypothetical protein